MSIITKSNVVKGTPAQFTLSRAGLAEHPVVLADSYFQDSGNWYRVNAVYKSSPGSQYEIVEFDATQSNPVGNFLISNKARDTFQIEKLVILDFDGGYLEIPRSELVVEDWDVAVS
jgi:hypothetical protein